ncbi:MAG: hypothetical protein AAFZ01_04825 [Pseudomonadota bacterium]
MALKHYQYAELIGIVLIVVSTAVQVFFVEPAKRKLELVVVGSYVSSIESNLSKELARNFRALAVRDGMSSDAADGLVRGLTANAREANRVMRYRSDLGRKTDVFEGIFTYVSLAVFVLGTLLTAWGRYADMRSRHAVALR